jgi:UDP-3-O-[3-hydroxymyristoyl] glucosamine N-acyltransferase
MNEKGKTLGELARLVGGETVGDPNQVVFGLADLASAGEGEISFLVKETLSHSLAETNAAAVIVPLSIETADKPLIRVKNPYLAGAIIQNSFLKNVFEPTGISSKAYIGKDCQIPAEISIAHMVSIGDRVKLGKRVTIQPGVVIGDDVTIGDDCFIYANVTIYRSSIIGSRVMIHSGTVIGSDGFGFATDDNGSHIKWPHIGTAQIDDDVDIGANVTIDRGTFRKTHIMRGVRIDNLVQIGHNVKVGENSIIVAQVGIAGSASLGKNVVLGGQAAIKGHIHLDDGSMVAAKSGVHGNLKKGSVVAGIPAIPHKNWLKSSIILSKLPQIYSDISDLKNKITRLYEKVFPEDSEK